MKKVLVYLFIAAAFCFAQTSENDGGLVEKSVQTESVDGLKNMFDYNYDADSARFYVEKAYKHRYKEDKQRNTSTVFFIVGGALAIGGGALITYGALNLDSDREFAKQHPDDGAPTASGLAIVFGSISAVVGGAGVAMGFVFRRLAKKNGAKAEMFEQKASHFKNHQSVRLDVAPIVDPVCGRLGAIAVLGF